MSRMLWIFARQGLADLPPAAHADCLVLEGGWEKADISANTPSPRHPCIQGRRSAPAIRPDHGTGALSPLGLSPLARPSTGETPHPTPDLCPGQKFSLDALLDARWTWIDDEAARLADLAANTTETASTHRKKSAHSPGLGSVSRDPLRLSVEWIDALALRYAMVRWLRVVAFFTCFRPLQSDERVEAFLAPDRDDDYALLLEQLAHQAGAKLTIHRIADGWKEPVWLAPNERWRQWLGKWARRCNPRISASSRVGRKSRQPVVLLCGNPRILDPVCQALLDRQVGVWWLYERFAVRAWLRWRTFGVGQLWCDGPSKQDKRSETPWQQVSDRLLPGRIGPLCCQGIDLGQIVRHWTARRAQSAHARYAQWIEQVEGHLARVRPQAVVVDEDATPFARVVVAAARGQGVPSWVVQHGAPYVRFGFVPLEADSICVWDQASATQLTRWGVSPERIVITGSPWQEKMIQQIRQDRDRSSRRKGFLSGVSRPQWFRRTKHQISDPPIDRTIRQFSPSPPGGVQEVPPPRFRVLLLTTVPPRDHRPDPVGFHLTTASYAGMVRSAFAAVDRMSTAQLIVKLHPRCQHDPWVEAAQKDFPWLPVERVNDASLAKCLAQADCVLSCVSSAGVDAVQAGWPVIQLLPEGSAELLSGPEWGFVGTARTENELYTLLCQVCTAWSVLADSSPIAAGRLPYPGPLGTGHGSLREFSESDREVKSGLCLPVRPGLSAADRIAQTVTVPGRCEWAYGAQQLVGIAVGTEDHLPQQNPLVTVHRGEDSAQRIQRTQRDETEQ